MAISGIEGTQLRLGIQGKSLPRKLSKMFKWKRTKTDTGRQVLKHQGEQVIIG